MDDLEWDHGYERPCRSCDGSGFTRRVGRDNDEIVEDCGTCDGTGTQEHYPTMEQALEMDQRKLDALMGKK